jgi:hypothetical protein
MRGMCFAPQQDGFENQEGESEMDNYEGALETEAPQTRGDKLTKSAKEYAPSMPSSAYLGIAAGAMILSLVCELTGRNKWGNFIAQWVPVCLIIGVYNKLVKLEAHDHSDRSHTRGYTS